VRGLLTEWADVEDAHSPFDLARDRHEGFVFRKDRLVEKKRILVVDDEPAVTRVIVEFLVRTGYYEVRALNEPERAIEVARDFRPDLLVLDIIMPGMDGGELLAAMREVPVLRDLPAIFLTGLVSESEVGPGGFEVGGQPVVAKPVRAQAFRSLVAERLGMPDQVLDDDPS
jgi:two-component system, OmpR family, response regulator